LASFNKWRDWREWGLQFAISELQAVKVLVGAAEIHQLFVRALFGDTPFGDYGDRVGTFDRREAVGDDDGRSAAAELVECLLDHDFGRVVEGGGRFVED